MIVGSRLDDWIYWTSLLRLQLIITAHTLNSFLITNLSLYFFWFSDWSQLRLSLSCRSQSLSLMLRPTVSRPVYLVDKHPSGAYDQISVTVRQLRVCWCGALSLTRERVCHLQLLLVFASAVILRFETPQSTKRVWVLCYDRRSVGQTVLEYSTHQGLTTSQSVAGLLMCGALSDERAGLSFTTAAGTHQRIHSLVRVPWDLRPYLTVSDSRFPFLPLPTTRRVTVEVFDPASTRECQLCVLSWPGADRRENTTSYSSLVILRIRCNGNSLLREQCLPSRCLAADVTVMLLWLRTSGFQASCHNTYHISTSGYNQYLQNRHDILKQKTTRSLVTCYITHVHATYEHSTIHCCANLYRFIHGYKKRKFRRTESRHYMLHQ
jgi:hypothetical protein